MRAHRVCVGAPQPRTDDDGRPEPLHSNPGNEAALPLEPNSGPLHLAELVEVVGTLKEDASFLGRRGYTLEWHAGPGAYEVLFEGHDERVLVRPANLVRARSLDYSGQGYIFNPLPEVRDGPRAARSAPHPRPALPRTALCSPARRVRVPRQGLNLKEVPEPSSNRKPLYYMLSMLCARPRLAPHAPAPPRPAPRPRP